MSLEIDFSNFKFRCSSLGHLMTEPKNKSEILSEGAKTHLVDVYISNRYGINDDIANKYIEKGVACEEDSITLYSRVNKSFFKKNTERLYNEYIQGEPDLFLGNSIKQASKIIDIKSSWSIYTFFRTFTKKINSMYYWQGQGYMYLTGASDFELAYCLVSTPENIIENELKNLWYQLGQPDFSSDLYINASDELSKSMRFDQIPIRERLLSYAVQRNEADIQKINDKVIAAREYLKKLQSELKIKQQWTSKEKYLRSDRPKT